EIADWTRAAGIRVAGLIELINQDRAGMQLHGLQVVGPEDVAPGGRAVLGAGGDRRSMWERLAAFGWEGIAVVHPAAVPAADAAVREGATIGPGAVIGACTVIGEHAIVSRGALIGHHADIGAYATVNPGAN